jgi:hypothetical protein
VSSILVWTASDEICSRRAEICGLVFVDDKPDTLAETPTALEESLAAWFKWKRNPPGEWCVLNRQQAREVCMKDQPKQAREALQTWAKVIAMHVRNNVEDFHGKHLSLAQMDMTHPLSCRGRLLAVGARAAVVGKGVAEVGAPSANFLMDPG